MITIDSIQQALAQEYGIPAARMREPFMLGGKGINTRDACYPRQAAMALSVLLTDHSRTRIGHFFGGRDRATVYHACSAVAKRRRTDARLHNAMRRVTLDLVRR